MKSFDHLDETNGIAMHNGLPGCCHDILFLGLVFNVHLHDAASELPLATGFNLSKHSLNVGQRGRKEDIAMGIDGLLRRGNHLIHFVVRAATPCSLS